MQSRHAIDISGEFTAELQHLLAAHSFQSAIIWFRGPSYKRFAPTRPVSDSGVSKGRHYRLVPLLNDFQKDGYEVELEFVPFGTITWDLHQEEYDAGDESDGVVQQQRKNAAQLDEWERSGRKSEWEKRRSEEKPNVEESIGLSRRILSDASAVAWKFQDGKWEQIGSLAPNVLQVSFSFVDRDGNAMDGSGKAYIIRKAERILEEQKQSGRWIEVLMTPVTEENKLLHNFDTLRPPDKDDAVFETLSDPSKRTEEIAARLIEKAQVHACRYIDGQIVEHEVTPEERTRYHKMACKLLWIISTSERKRKNKGGGCWVPTRSCVDLHTLGAALTPDEELMSLEDVRERYAPEQARGRRGRPPLKPYEARNSRKKRRESQRKWVAGRRELNKGLGVDQQIPPDPQIH